MKLSYEVVLPADSFTYVSYAHGSCSWLGLYVSLKSAMILSKTLKFYTNSFIFSFFLITGWYL